MAYPVQRSRAVYLVPKPVTVMGELSADGQNVVLVCVGAPHDQMAVSRQIAAMTPTVRDTKPPGALLMPLSWPAVVQLAYTFGSSWVPGPRLAEWARNEGIRRASYTTKPLRYQLPEGCELRPWQPEAVRMLAHNGCLLEDAPRLGKTITTVVGLAERAVWGHVVTPIIVVCPSSVITAWVRAFERWAPHWKAVAWRGPKRKHLVGHYHVYVTGYDTTRRDAHHQALASMSPLLAIKANTVVIDEYHWIKNPDAQRTKATQRIAGQARLVVPLSGTPFTHNWADTNPTLRVFEPGAFPSKERQRDRYCITSQGDYGITVHGLIEHREPELRACFLGRQIRRSRADVFPGQDKTYDTRIIEMPPAYQRAYDGMERQMLAELEDGEELTAFYVVEKIIRLQQLSASAVDVTYEQYTHPKTGEERTRTHVTPKLPSWKIDAMLDVLAELDCPALVFALSKPLIELAGAAAAAAGARVGYVVGGQSPRARDADVDAFQAGRLDLLCITVEAGGTGLTLDAAGAEIFLQRPASLVTSLQAEDRAVRPGKAPVDVLDIFAAGTIDQRIRTILHGKAAQLGEYFQDPRIVGELFGGVIRPKRKAVAAS
jgi:hypothetical protein